MHSSPRVRNKTKFHVRGYQPVDHLWHPNAFHEALVYFCSIAAFCMMKNLYLISENMIVDISIWQYLLLCTAVQLDKWQTADC